jgi:hypothetical protein
MCHSAALFDGFGRLPQPARVSRGARLRAVVDLNNRTHEIAVNPLTRLESRSVMRRGEISGPRLSVGGIRAFMSILDALVSMFANCSAEG